MGWAEKRIEEYKQGKDATWLERRTLEHANPMHLIMAVIGAGFLISGLWIHDGALISAGVALILLGHLYCWLKK